MAPVVDGVAMTPEEADFKLAGGLAVGDRVWVIHLRCYGVVVKTTVYGAQGAYEVELEDKSIGHGGSGRYVTTKGRWYISGGKNPDSISNWSFEVPEYQRSST
jgi:hypothetical protein